MQRREFLQVVALSGAGLEQTAPPAKPELDGYTLVSEFKLDSTAWKAYEDLRTREGPLVFVSSRGQQRVLPKSAEATTQEGPPYLGMTMDEIGRSAADLMAERLLEKGDDPDPQRVKSAVPPIEFLPQTFWQYGTFVGTKEAYDTQPVYYGGNTTTYRPTQYVPELRQLVNQKRVFDGLLGGWLPAIRKVMPVSDGVYWELITFGDVEGRDKYIVQTWHRIARIENGKMVKAFYSHTYPPFPPRRKDPKPEEFYRGLLVFAQYWDAQLREFVPTSLPDADWVHMAKHSFAKELMARPGGVDPKYGAVVRNYAASEFDGFQDTFTSSVYTNLEWGRLETARLYIDDYFSKFVEPTGMVNMRGPETAQFGLTLSLLARYFNYARDSALLLKHQAKIQATASLLYELHEESLRLPPDSPGYGLIHGWSESDACLRDTPMVYWQPYYGNTAFAVRGFKDMGQAWLEIARSKPNPALEKEGRELLRRSQVLRDILMKSIEKYLRKDLTPPYVPPMPGTKTTFWDDHLAGRMGPQAWVHRLYIDLLQADVLPPDLANMTLDTLRAYGGTTLCVTNGLGAVGPYREMLGFISYGHAQMLLRADRVEEFLLFLYAHRYHCHTRGHWTGCEVVRIPHRVERPDLPFCMPAQQQVPMLVRWMLVLEDSDEDRLYLAKGVPRAWVISGKEIKIDRAPTRWGRVNFSLVARPETKSVVGQVELAPTGAPKEVHLKIRLPKQNTLGTVTVNGRPARVGGIHNDTVIFEPQKEKRFEVVARFS